MQQNQEKDVPECMEDDVEVALQEFSSMSSSLNHSAKSETERKSQEIRRKVEQYLKQHTDLLSKFNLDEREKAEDLDGQLIDQLKRMENIAIANEENQRFILLFNKNPWNGIAQYVQKGYIHEDSSPAIAEYVFQAKGINKNTLGEFFGKNDPKIQQILKCYCKNLKFKNVEFDIAMRLLLGRFRLPGQAQQVERVIEQFSIAYCEDNPQSQFTPADLFTLSYAIIMLATDAHNPKQEHKMTLEEFLRNTLPAAPSVSKEYLTLIYERITKEKFSTLSDYFEDIYGRLKDLAISNIEQAIKYSTELMKGNVVLKICKRNGKFVQRLLQLSDDEQRILWVTDPPKGQEKPRFIYIKDITDLALGRGSEVMKKAKVPPQFDCMCMTITTTERTLDVKAKNTQERGKWMNYLRAILLQRRDQRRRQMEDQFNSLVNNDILEQIWNNDIFPFWDSHWDYQSRKPKTKGYISKGFETLCFCFRESNANPTERTKRLGIPSKETLLETLWRQGLPHSSRKTLWPLVIGSNLALNSVILEDIRKRKKTIEEFSKSGLSPSIIQMSESLITMRPDIPPVREVLLMSEVFDQVFPKKLYEPCLSSLLNLIHTHHFLSFYRGDMNQINLRIELFEHLMHLNVPSVGFHFAGIKLETRMYLVPWFLSVYAECCRGEFLLKIWDNFLLEGESYLFKVGITLLKYYEIELKMCTFEEGLKMLKTAPFPSSVLFNYILNHQIDVTIEHYENYIQKRKHAFIKTNVQAIPLQE